MFGSHFMNFHFRASMIYNSTLFTNNEVDLGCKYIICTEIMTSSYVLANRLFTNNEVDLECKSIVFK